jgi:hypothetical protein
MASFPRTRYKYLRVLGSWQQAEDAELLNSATVCLLRVRKPFTRRRHRASSQLAMLSHWLCCSKALCKTKFKTKNRDLGSEIDASTFRERELSMLQTQVFL